MDAEAKREHRAAKGGVYAIVATGVFAVARLAPQARDALDYVVLAVIAVCAIGGAWLLHRFVAKHGDEIGEARFDTRNRKS